jgi:hypothetical protein
MEDSGEQAWGNRNEITYLSRLSKKIVEPGDVSYE